MISDKILMYYFYPAPNLSREVLFEKHMLAQRCSIISLYLSASVAVLMVCLTLSSFVHIVTV